MMLKCSAREKKDGDEQLDEMVVAATSYRKR